ncbi:MAG: hypothetical protein QOE27_231 [Solirubrobacteraceae bacterium]|jgi:hypothetical protein|nr:hypothetical protein [Solirubrobacteraceae bacterium]MEA2301007.1 hypothetical protein [Solirubrobacteraceae bacterium]MEA2354652.1 hypothetical protein [Solirubrobacteraceae bacterium]
MSADPRAALRARLDEPLPERLWSLPDAELADLDDALTDAHRRQSAALDRSIDQTLRFLPWPLRSIVRRILLP